MRSSTLRSEPARRGRWRNGRPPRDDGGPVLDHRRTGGRGPTGHVYRIGDLIEGHHLHDHGYAGDSALGSLAFEPPDPTACAGAGATTAGIEGVVGLGSS